MIGIIPDIYEYIGGCMTYISLSTTNYRKNKRNNGRMEWHVI